MRSSINLELSFQKFYLKINKAIMYFMLKVVVISNQLIEQTNPNLHFASYVNS